MVLYKDMQLPVVMGIQQIVYSVCGVHINVSMYIVEHKNKNEKNMLALVSSLVQPIATEVVNKKKRSVLCSVVHHQGKCTKLLTWNFKERKTDHYRYLHLSRFT